jgi:ATP-grasp domain
MMVAARKIARRLSLSGFFGLDFVIEEGTGAAYLIEMNPRCTPPSHLRLGIGRDMIGSLSAKLTGKPLEAPASITQNNLVAYFPQAFRCNSEFLSSSYHDVPRDEPELIQELLLRWSDKGAMSTAFKSLRGRFFFNRRARLRERSCDRSLDLTGWIGIFRRKALQNCYQTRALWFS